MVTIKDGYAEFRFFKPDAKEVLLVGDFNEWHIHPQAAMLRQKDGYWLAILKLPTGVHQFKYFADGYWYIDYAAFGLDYGKFGLNSVVMIPKHILKCPHGGTCKKK
jgi:1,4-alpha-glucan branching enzyme